MVKYQKTVKGELLGVLGMATAVMPTVEIEEVTTQVLPKDTATRKRRTKRKLAKKAKQRQRRKK